MARTAKQPVTYGMSRRQTPPVLWLRCSYGDRQVAKRLGGRWNPDEKVWEWQLTTPDTERVVLAGINQSFAGAQHSQRELTRPPLPECAEPLSAMLHDAALYAWPSLREPYDHQREVVQASMVRDRLLVMYEMGTGKTQAAIEAACVAMDDGDVQRVYIVCPTSVRTVWAKEIGTCAWVRGNDIAMVRGNPPTGHPDRKKGMKDAEYRRWQEDRLATWTVMHYAAARIDAGRLAPHITGQFLIIDEAHALRNPQAQRTKAIYSWNPARAIVQTGTPVVNTPADIWTGCDFCEKGLLGTSMYDFRKRFVRSKRVPPKVDPVTGKVVRPAFDIDVGYNDIDEIRTRLASVGIRRTKEECLDLPEKVRQDRTCEMSPDQKRAYDGVRADAAGRVREMIADAGGLEQVNRGALLGQLVRLQQVADGFIPDADHEGVHLWFDDCGKFEALDEIVHDAMESGRKIVLWGRFVPLVRKLAERYAEQGAVYISGEVGFDERDARINRFCDDPDCRVFVSIVHVGSLGLNLQVANLVVFVDRWWSPAIVSQAEDRCHRSGQHSVVDVINLVTENSIDEHVGDVLEGKREVARDVVELGGVEAHEEAQLDLAAISAALGIGDPA